MSEASLWTIYQATGSDRSRNDLFDFHYQWLRSEVYAILKRRGQLRFFQDMLSEVCWWMLVKWIPCHASLHDESFRSTIHAALPSDISDAMRCLNPDGRAIGNIPSKVRAAKKTLTQALHHAPTDREVAEFLAIPESSVIQASIPGDISAHDRNVIHPTHAIHRSNHTNGSRELFDHLTNAMSPTSRKIACWCFHDGYSARDIARRFGVSERAIFKKLNKIKQFMRKSSVFLALDTI